MGRFYTNVLAAPWLLLIASACWAYLLWLLVQNLQRRVAAHRLIRDGRLAPLPPADHARLLWNLSLAGIVCAAAVAILTPLVGITGALLAGGAAALLILIPAIARGSRGEYWAHVAGVKVAPDERVDALIDRLRQSLPRHPIPGGARNLLGMMLCQKAQWDAALEAFRDAERADGRRAVYLVNQAYVLGQLGRMEEALALMEEGRTLDPHEAAYALRHALLLQRIGRHDEAAEQLRQAELLLQLLPNRQYAPEVIRNDLLSECRDSVQAAPTGGFPLGSPSLHAMPAQPLSAHEPLPQPVQPLPPLEPPARA